MGAGVGLALVGDRQAGTADRDWVLAGSYEIDLAGQRIPVWVGLRGPFDPEGRRLAPESAE